MNEQEAWEANRSIVEKSEAAAAGQHPPGGLMRAIYIGGSENIVLTWDPQRRAWFGGGYVLRKAP